MTRCLSHQILLSTIGYATVYSHQDTTQVLLGKKSGVVSPKFIYRMTHTLHSMAQGSALEPRYPSITVDCLQIRSANIWTYFSEILAKSRSRTWI